MKNLLLILSILVVFSSFASAQLGLADYSLSAGNYTATYNGKAVIDANLADDTFMVSVPDTFDDECFARGDSEEHCTELLREALEFEAWKHDQEVQKKFKALSPAPITGSISEAELESGISFKTPLVQVVAELSKPVKPIFEFAKSFYLSLQAWF